MKRILIIFGLLTFAIGGQTQVSYEDDADAREARCNARRMNNPALAAALANIEADLAEAEQAASELGNADAKTAVEDAKAAAANARMAHKNGKYCQAYDLFNEAYGYLSNSYAIGANHYVGKSDNAVVKQAAEDADLYAEASHKDGLDCAMAASRNARISYETARDAFSGSATHGTVTTANRTELQNHLNRIEATVRFDFAATEPQFDQATDLAINTLCKAMAADKNLKVLITGHTDNVGSAAANMAYGRKRAEALKALMVKRGAPAAQISTASRGEEEPVADNDTDEHRKQNRRAVITLK